MIIYMNNCNLIYVVEKSMHTNLLLERASLSLQDLGSICILCSLTSALAYNHLHVKRNKICIHIQQTGTNRIEMQIAERGVKPKIFHQTKF